MPFYLIAIATTTSIFTNMVVFGPEAMKQAEEEKGWMKKIGNQAVKVALLLLFFFNCWHDVSEIANVKGETFMEKYACGALIWSSSGNVATGFAMNALGVAFEQAKSWPQVHTSRADFTYPANRGTLHDILEVKGLATWILRICGQFLYFWPLWTIFSPFVVGAALFYCWLMVPVLWLIVRTSNYRFVNVAVSLKKGTHDNHEALYEKVETVEDMRDIYRWMYALPSSVGPRKALEVSSDATIKAAYSSDAEAFMYIGTTSSGVAQMLRWPLLGQTIFVWAPCLMTRFVQGLLKQGVWDGDGPWGFDKAAFADVYWAAITKTFAERHWYTYRDHVMKSIANMLSVLSRFV